MNGLYASDIVDLQQYNYCWYHESITPTTYVFLTQWDEIYSEEVSTLWQYWLWSFQRRDTKLERFLDKNNCSQMKLLNF